MSHSLSLSARCWGSLTLQHDGTIRERKVAVLRKGALFFRTKAHVGSPIECPPQSMCKPPGFGGWGVRWPAVVHVQRLTLPSRRRPGLLARLLFTSEEPPQGVRHYFLSRNFSKFLKVFEGILKIFENFQGVHFAGAVKKSSRHRTRRSKLRIKK